MKNIIKLNAYCNFVMRFVLIFAILLIPSIIKADSFQKYVGQTFILPIPRCPASNGFINSWSYSCTSTNISITNRGSSNPSEAVITSYFDGTITIECYFQYIVYINGFPQSHTSREFHQVRCLSNDISISGSRNTLEVGETMQLDYQFYTITYDAQPQITWRCNSNVASVNANGLVTARSSGEATITASSNLGGNTASYTIFVENVDPISVSINSSNSVPCDGTLQLDANVFPTNASQRVNWSIIAGSSFATISDNGLLSGKASGTVTVKATAENGVSATHTITVYEPKFKVSTTYPSNNAVSQNVFITPNLTFSHAAYKGNNFNEIKLKSSNGDNIEGIISISDKRVLFKPNRPLKPQTTYILTFPANSVTNKWGTHYSDNYTITFTTGNLEKLTLEVNPPNKFIKKGALIKLTSNKPNAKIYYTTDGSTPSEKSSEYKSPITINNDTKLNAIAILEGYENSNVLSKQYIISNVAVVGVYPNNENPLYIYSTAIPSMKFSNKIEASSNINNTTFFCAGKGELQKRIIVCDSAIYVIPEEPLELGQIYKISVPANAIKTWQGEYNEAAEWTFTTGYFAKNISATGSEIAMSLQSDNNAFLWGAKFTNGNNSNGSFEYTSVPIPTKFLSDVIDISSGYTHNAVIKSDGSLWMWGRQYCGEFGNNSLAQSATPIKILSSGVKSVTLGCQTTAIIKEDNSLWMTGRNDFGQLGIGTTNTFKSFVKILDNVKMVSAGWGTTFAITNSGDLYGWGKNIHHILSTSDTINFTTPKLLMENIKSVSTSISNSKYCAIINDENELIIYSSDKTPYTLDHNVTEASVGRDFIHYIKYDGSLWAMGINNYGQLGSGDVNTSLSPIKIMNGVSKVQSAIESTFIIKENGSVWTWGHNSNSILGQENNFSEIAPSPIQIIEGMQDNELTGAVCNKKTLYIGKAQWGIIPIYPQPLTANYSEIQWTSSRPEILTVDEKGIIFGVEKGESKVTAKIIDSKGKSYSVACNVVVDTNNTSVDNIDNSFININVDGLSIHVSNVPQGEIVKFINTEGVILSSVESIGQEIIFEAKNSGVYMILCNGYSQKILCK